MSVAWRGTCLCFSYLCYFVDAFVMQYISPINLHLLKASLVYGKRLKICVRCTSSAAAIWSACNRYRLYRDMSEILRYCIAILFM